jgi:hypothetical protein
MYDKPHLRNEWVSFHAYDMNTGGYMKRFHEGMKRLYVPPEWLGPLKNPCKGWVAQPINEKKRKDPDGDLFAGYCPDYFQLFSVAYKRFNWKDINPSKDCYDFSLVDAYLDAVAQHGWTAGIGFLTPAASTSNALSFVPDYLYEEGMQFVESIVENNHTFEQWPQRTPVWDDPVYLKYCDIVIQKLADRYDGDERIFYINPLSYGNWGEWHTQFLGDSKALTFEQAKVHVQLWAKHFKSSTMQIPINHHMPEMVAQWACDTYRWGMTRWGLVFLQDDHYAASYCLGVAPALGEFYTFYENTKKWGAWSDERMINVVEGGHMTNMRPYGADENLIYLENKKLMEHLQNRMGYHIVVTHAAEYFESNEEGECEFGMIIHNKGVAPMYFDCRFVVALLDDQNRVLEKFDSGIQPRRWQGNSYGSFRFRVPIADREGKVAVGLFKSNTAENPDVLWANSQLENGWLVLR